MWWGDLEALKSATKVDFDACVEPDIHPAAVIADGVVLDTSGGPISIGAGSRICRGACIVGPATIGSDCLVGNNALVRGPARIGDKVRIGFGAEIKAAIIEDDVTIGPQCFVADSKLETGVYLGAQVRTSNHRLDKKNVSIMVDGSIQDSGIEKLGCLIGAHSALGIQVIVLPGREIAPHSVFAPRVTIERNLPSGRYRPTQHLETF